MRLEELLRLLGATSPERPNGSVATSDRLVTLEGRTLESLMVTSKTEPDAPGSAGLHVVTTSATPANRQAILAIVFERTRTPPAFDPLVGKSVGLVMPLRTVHQLGNAYRLVDGGLSGHPRGCPGVSP